MAFAFRCPLYPIVDDSRADRSPLDLVERILASGIPLLQLRVKQAPTGEFVELAREVLRRCRLRSARLIVNDRADVAQLVGADGVHLGQDDLDPAAARRILGPESIIGYSTHNPDQLARVPRCGEVDYVAFGPVFSTTGKANPDPVVGLAGLRVAAAACSLPLVGIGGIDSHTIGAVIASGAAAAAVIGAIAGAADPLTATRELYERAVAAS